MITNPVVSAPSAANSSNGAANSSAAGDPNSSDAVGSQNYFLKLLVAQMNNQDPLNPMDSAQVTSQMAEINTVQGIQTLSTQLTQLLATVGSTQSIQDTALVGQQVLVPGNTINLSGTSAQAAVGLAQAATQVTVTISDASGRPIRTLKLGAEPAGTIDFTWDGKSDSGAVAAPGDYAYAVNAVSGGQAVTSTAYAQGLVTAITPSATGSTLNVAGLGTFNVSQVQQIQ